MLPGRGQIPAISTPSPFTDPTAALAAGLRDRYVVDREPRSGPSAATPLLKIPYEPSPGWVRIDPTFAPLKGNPRFERLVAGK